jgi:hypothetical protein
MNKIRESVTTKETRIETRTQTKVTPVACEWSIPPAPDGKTFDKNKVNVEYSSGANLPARVGVVPTQADCANVEQGWYYDDVANPTKVLVCPQTCQTVQAINDAQVRVIFGCETEEAIIK